jgi:aquaporin Z
MTTQPHKVHRSAIHMPRMRARREGEQAPAPATHWLARESMTKYAAEMLGTFFLTLTVVVAVGEEAVLAALAIGSALMVMVYATGHISGGHLNPAVSLAAFVRGRLSAADLAPYWAAQVVGALLAALIGLWWVDIPQAPALEGDLIAKAFLAELLFTFALAFVVLNVATSKDHPDNSFYGLAIGFTVVAGAVAIGPISGAALNPAVAIGVALSGLGAWSSIWIYLVACLLGGALAGVVFKLLNPDDA